MAIALKDIAVRTGLSINTVSRAIRGSGYVSPRAREDVMRAVRETGYRPNRAAKSLRCRSNFEIAVITFLSGDRRQTDYLYLHKIAGMKNRFMKSGHEITLHFIDDTLILRQEAEMSLNDIISQEPAGAIIFGGALQEKIYDRFQQHAIPAVIISQPECDADFVCVNRHQGVSDAVRYLYDTGRRRIAFVGESENSSKFKGYRDTVRAAALPELFFPFDALLSDLETIHQFGIRTAHKIAAMNPRPDAVQTSSDYVAAGILAGFHELGVKVPREIAVFGFDGRDLALSVWPSLSTIAQPNIAVGETAAEILLKKISEKIMNLNCARLVPMKLIIRDST